MYIVAILSADGTEAEMLKFFERLPDARAYARQQVQSAERADIYDVPDLNKPDLIAAIGAMVTCSPIEIIGRKPTDNEIAQQQRQWLRNLGFNI